MSTLFKVLASGGVPGGEAGVGFELGGYSDGTHLVKWKSGRALSKTCGTAKLKCWVIRALSSYPPGVEVRLSYQ